MAKITVLDSKNRFHLFTGEHVTFYIGPDGCQIVDFARSETKDIAFFKSYEWVKREDEDLEQDLSPIVMTAKDEKRRLLNKQVADDALVASFALDKFTEQDIAKRDNKPLDASTLAPQEARDEVKEEKATEVTQEETEQPTEATEPEQQGLLPEEIPEIDIEATLAEAEKRHKEKSVCETCGGAGTVPDPESNDPLDTIMCSDC